ncbi:MAG: ATP synthase F1 subunit gamma [Candidatus Yonathbacteria bacterium RIFOXYD1_FULL_52_36]|uniref:ATP synthase gamma chain n=1 Tax=Candidatus Yonathbacteria bacterium RIFOXYD1_FULL_52_36 TaxID=1802730 RepID=A0A1G2SL12_9BACT|nr:MAG: ATP synthase F1 subunit gamma [Candidatus Yonathbacteria bacterium RIFOXYD1_FULL_52_36]
MSLKSIKTKIISVQKTHQVTRAMEAVSAVKMRKAQVAALAGRPYALHALSILRRVMESKVPLAHPFMRKSDVRGVVMIVITSDKGLAGALNSAVIKAAVREMSARGLTREDVRFITIGKKGYEYFSKRGFTVEHALTLREDRISHETLRETTNEIMRLAHDETMGAVLAVYTHFRSTMIQEAVVRKIVPLDPLALAETVRGILPEQGKYAELAGMSEAEETRAVEYTFEPSAQSVLDELVPFLLSVELLHAVLESQASEHSARMVAMKNASSKADEVAEDLTRAFNKARQGAITSEVSEIVGGVEAMK